jgi:hypothetical protein
VRDEDGVDLPEDDFRRLRRYLAPSVFASWDGEATEWPPPWELIGRREWDGIMDLPTDVGLKSTSYEGATVSRLYRLHSDWIFSWPEVGEAPFMEELVLLAGEEFDALVFNAAHGWYRQAIGCLRNALETLLIGAALAVREDGASFEQWREGIREVRFGNARELIRDSAVGRQVDGDAAPASVFGDDSASWAKARYSRLCAYAHSQAGYNNADFWESNGPIFVPSALAVVEAELRETLALCYLLVRLAWPAYHVGQGQPALLDGALGEWAPYEPMLRKWLLVDEDTAAVS